MNGWINFWGALLLVTLVIYGVLVIYVSIGGLRDIRKMFSSLSNKSKKVTENTLSSDSESQPWFNCFVEAWYWFSNIISGASHFNEYWSAFTFNDSSSHSVVRHWSFLTKRRPAHICTPCRNCRDGGSFDFLYFNFCW